MEHHPTIYYLDGEDLASAANDPALAALLTQGWEVATTFLVNDGGRFKQALLMIPPTKHVVPKRILGEIGATVVIAILIAEALMWALRLVG